jgi:hypothetical protein
MMKNKGFFEGVIMMFVIYLFAVAIVVVFFYFFKYHITITMLDEYKWSKVQEVPLDLLSIDLNGESFVSKMNKVYYGFYDSSKLRDETKEYVYNQFFYSLGGNPKGIIFSVDIGNLNIVSAKSPCTCNDNRLFGTALQHNRYLCSDNCVDVTGKSLGGRSCETWDTWGRLRGDIKKCVYSESYYSAGFPFPLTFNGTENFIDSLNYEISDQKGLK